MFPSFPPLSSFQAPWPQLPGTLLRPTRNYFHLHRSFKSHPQINLNPPFSSFPSRRVYFSSATLFWLVQQQFNPKRAKCAHWLAGKKVVRNSNPTIREVQPAPLTSRLPKKCTTANSPLGTDSWTQLPPLNQTRLPTEAPWKPLN